MNYSKIPTNSVGSEDFLYNRINETITSTTLQKRNQLKATLDHFCTFWWRGIDAFKTFGAFIINKNDLKFYNGPGFSNDYTQPQFESAAGQLTGVKFKTQQISFTIGVYWISIEHYRQLIYWLHPYEINTLSFGFDTNHYYQVKLANISDSARSIIGKEVVGYKVTTDYPAGDPKQPIVENRYYTELKLTFEIQGTPCAYSWDEIKFEKTISDTSSIEFAAATNDNDALVSSDLEAPIQTSFALKLGLNTNNFIIENGGQEYYNIQNTTWKLITTLDGSMISASTTYNWTSLNFQSKEIQFKGIVCSTDGSGKITLKYIKTADSSQVTVFTNEAWIDSAYQIIRCGSLDNNIIKSSTSTALLNFLIQNSSIEYYEDMKLNVTLSAGIKNSDPSLSDVVTPKTLFDITLKNLTWGNPIEEEFNVFDLGYDSESGLLYLSSADSEYFLLNTLSTSAKGQRIVDSMLVNTFAIPGLFNDPWFDIKKLYFTLTLVTYAADGTITSTLTITDQATTGATIRINGASLIDLSKSYISLRGRTNLI